MKKWLVVSLMVVLLSGCTGKQEVESTKEASANREETTEPRKAKHTRRRKRVKKATEATVVSSETSESKHERTKDSAKQEQAVSTKVFSDPDESEEIGYFNDGQSFGAVVPDFKQYSKADAIVILGEPVQVVTEKSELVSRLDLEGSEVDRIKGEFQARKLTESQAKAFIFQAADIKIVAEMGSDVEGLIYDDPKKPNVYLLKGEVVFVTPIIEYMEFSGRLVL